MAVGVSPCPLVLGHLLAIRLGGPLLSLCGSALAAVAHVLHSARLNPHGWRPFTTLLGPNGAVARA
eukprot:14314872-Alexandrium_andersonii.AAC.1